MSPSNILLLFVPKVFCVLACLQCVRCLTVITFAVQLIIFLCLLFSFLLFFFIFLFHLFCYLCFQSSITHVNLPADNPLLISTGFFSLLWFFFFLFIIIFSFYFIPFDLILPYFRFRVVLFCFSRGIGISVIVFFAKVSPRLVQTF